MQGAMHCAYFLEAPDFLLTQYHMLGHCISPLHHSPPKPGAATHVPSWHEPKNILHTTLYIIILLV